MIWLAATVTHLRSRFLVGPTMNSRETGFASSHVDGHRFVQSRWLALLPAIGILLGLVAADKSANGAEDRDLFATQVRVLLATRCLECHRGKEPEGGLDLGQRDKLASGGETGVAIVAGKPDESLLWQRVADDEMPPKHPLSKKEKELLRQWIDGGAVWTGNPTIDRFQFSSSSRAGYDWWSLQPLRTVTPPQVAERDWPRSDLDRFVLARLEAADLNPSPAAKPRALIRRLYVDLIGLPPTPEQVAAFVNDPSDAAYEALVNRLLDAPEYGQRWGRHWLDVVRFGESDGFERNGPRKNFWHYRDWVIDAFNADLPYDEFVRQQLAGDLLVGGREGAASAGFLVAGVHNTVVGSSERMKLLARQDELEEIIAAVSQSFLGLTVNCGRCHDHKFDPIRSEEYYRMISALAGVRHGERDVSQPAAAIKLAALQPRMEQLRRAIGAIGAGAREAILAKRAKEQSASPTTDRPRPLATWEFEGDLKDSLGSLHGKAFGHARVAQGALVVDGIDSYVQTAPLPKDLAAKTLEAWILLDNLVQRGGAAISIETRDGGTFDAIVFGEREPRRWMAGSNGFVRTKPFQGSEETQAADQPVHVAIVYQTDGTIIGYRNGIQYGQPYKSGHAVFSAGKSQIVFGLRHHQPGGNRMLAGRILRANLYDDALTPEAVAASAGVENRFVSQQAILNWLPEVQKSKRQQLRQELTRLEAEARSLSAQAKQKMYTVVPSKPQRVRVHLRGSVTDLGDEVTPGGIAAIAGVNAEFGLTADAPDVDRRKQLAAWVTADTNPLLARVIVNRVWHYHFGIGIVETPNDLGFNGGRPSHPELLDWLAVGLRADGYRLKQLHRLIVTSATYRQASTWDAAAITKDADNRLLWRHSPRRIEAEVVRDAMLQIAGQLNPLAGGPGFEDVSITPNNGTTYYEPIDPTGTEFHRRTVYRFTPRGGRSAMLDTFDCPDPSSAAPRRSVTTTPLQALSLLNSSFVLRMADHLAERVVKEVGTDPVLQVRQIWQHTIVRLPDAEEEKISLELVNEHGLPMLARALFNTNEFVVME